MRSEIQTPGTVGRQGAIGRFADAQLPSRMTWAQVPDSEVAIAAMHVVHIVPVNGSTIVQVNPTDPGTEGETTPGYLVRPSAYAPVVKAGRRC